MPTESLFLADPRSNSVRLVVPGAANQTFPPSGRFAPNGELIAVGTDAYADRSLHGLVLFSTRPGRKPKPLHARGFLPSWSPDATKLVYWNWPDIFTLTLAGGRPRRIHREGSSPLWSSRNVISFWEDAKGTVCSHVTICTMRPDGTGIKPVAFGGVFPDWSPHGYRLVTVRGTENWDQIDIGCPNGTGVRHLTTRIPPGLAISDVVWSPDGRKIAFDYKDDVYEIPSKPPHPLGPKSWRKVVANATVSDWQPLSPSPRRPPSAAQVCH